MTTQAHIKNSIIPFTGCCKPFNPEPWQNAEITWKNKIFLRDHVMSLFHVPLNMEQRVTHDMELIDRAHAFPPRQMILVDEGSPWSANVYIDVVKKVPGAQMTTLSGTFILKVFEGPYEDAGKWASEMRKFVRNQDEEVEKIYFYYTTCPFCAKAYGKNYVVLFAKIK